MANKVIDIKLTAVPKTYTDPDTGNIYDYYDYYLLCGDIDVKVSTSKKDFTAKKVLKKFVESK